MEAISSSETSATAYKNTWFITQKTIIKLHKLRRQTECVSTKSTCASDLVRWTVSEKKSIDLDSYFMYSVPSDCIRPTWTKIAFTREFFLQTSNATCNRNSLIAIGAETCGWMDRHGLPIMRSLHSKDTRLHIFISVTGESNKVHHVELQDL